VKLRVEVTAEDIAKGQREEVCLCPIALALSRCGVRGPAVAGAVGWTPGDNRWSVTFVEDYENETILPEECGTFASAFDKGEPVEPFTFEIEVPDTAVSK